MRKIKNEPFLKRGKTIEFKLDTNVNEDDESDTYKFEIFLEDDFRLLKEPNKDSVISKGMMNYWIYKNGDKTKTELQHCNSTIESFYKKVYDKSDKAKNADFWEEVYLQESGEKLKEYRNF